MLPLSHICLALYEVGSCPPFSFLRGMRPADTIIERLWSIAEPVCTNSGYELVDIVHSQSPQGWVLRVFIDHPPDPEQRDPDPIEGVRVDPPGDVHQDRSTIGLRDCEQISRQLSAILDVEDPLEHAYNLEVSSPGLDRPLRKPSHFRRYLGQIAKVTLRDGLDGRRNFKGTMVAVADSDSPEQRPAPESADIPAGFSLSDATTLVMNVDGTEYRLPLGDIQNARLVPDWNDLFRRKQKR